MKRILALDPSILHLGWAVIEEASTGQFHLYNYGTIIAPTEYRNNSLVVRISFVLTILEALYTSQPTLDAIVIERPEPWGSYKSLASAQSGSLQTLTLLTGALVGWALAKHSSGLLVKLIKVSQWKGQLPKEVTKKRMEKRYSVKFKTSDEADATGLGTWYLENKRRV